MATAKMQTRGFKTAVRKPTGCYIYCVYSLWLTDADKAHLDGSSSEVSELFDVLPLLADQGPDCLSWNKEVGNLLFWSLLLEKKKKTTQKYAFHYSTPLLIVAEKNISKLL